MSKTNIELKESLVTISTEIPYALKDQLKFSSYKEKMPIKDIVRIALETYLQKHNEKE